MFSIYISNNAFTTTTTTNEVNNILLLLLLLHTNEVNMLSNINLRLACLRNIIILFNVFDVLRNYSQEEIMTPILVKPICLFWIACITLGAFLIKDFKNVLYFWRVKTRNMFEYTKLLSIFPILGKYTIGRENNERNLHVSMYVLNSLRTRKVQKCYI